MPPTATQTLDPELKEMIGEVKKTLGEAAEVKSAVAQLEEQMKGIPKTLENKIKAVKNIAFDPVSSRYRGVFGSEENARGFGLLILREVQGHAWAGEALKSDFADVVKDFSTTDGAALLPEDYNASIVDLIESYGVFEPNALSYPMTSDRTRYPKKTGRTAAVPMDESTSVSETKPTVIGKMLTARKWGAYTEAPMEIEEDSAAAFGELVAMDMAEAHALAADQAGFLVAWGATDHRPTTRSPALSKRSSPRRSSSRAAMRGTILRSKITRKRSRSVTRKHSKARLAARPVGGRSGVVLLAAILLACDGADHACFWRCHRW